MTNIDTTNMSADEKQTFIRKLSNDEDLKKILADVSDTDFLDENYDTELGSLLVSDVEKTDAGYPLGIGFLPPAPVGSFALLSMIKSPLLGLDESSDDFIDVFRAIYIICEGQKALNPIMGMSCRIKQIAKLKNL